MNNPNLMTARTVNASGFKNPFTNSSTHVTIGLLLLMLILFTKVVFGFHSGYESPQSRKGTLIFNRYAR